MKIRIETPIATIKADLAEEYVAEILARTLDYACGYNSHSSPEPQTPTPVVETAPAPVETVQSITPKAPEPQKAEFRGFLHLKCEECGKFKSFMPKTPISKYKCDCGHITHLENMAVMRVNCKCGAQFKYLTNALDSQLSIDCYSCGSPVDLEYHERKQEYTTII